MENNSYDFETEPLGRSSFLTALCILTFIGSGWAILSSFWSYRTAPETATIFKKPLDTSKYPTLKKDSLLLKDSVRLHQRDKAPSVFEEKMKSSFSQMLLVDNIQNSAMGNFVAALFTLAGALLMWRLKRIGFYLYILGVLIGIISPFYIYGNNFLAVGLSAFGSFFGLIFIALYALNYKSFHK